MIFFNSASLKLCVHRELCVKYIDLFFPPQISVLILFFPESTNAFNLSARPYNSKPETASKDQHSWYIVIVWIVDIGCIQGAERLFIGH
jgi:hypothetical protein